MSDVLCTPGAVFSVAMNPAGTLVCSGGEDDRSYVWKPEDGSVLFECKGGGRDNILFLVGAFCHQNIDVRTVHRITCK